MLGSENPFIVYVVTLAAIAGGATRLDWLFGDAFRVAMKSVALDVCQITNATVCF